jgi:hypothetical protein
MGCRSGDEAASRSIALRIRIDATPERPPKSQKAHASANASATKTAVFREDAMTGRTISCRPW